VGELRETCDRVKVMVRQVSDTATRMLLHRMPEMTGGMLSGVILLPERAIENDSWQCCHEGSDWQRHAIQEMAWVAPARASEIIVLPGRMWAVRVDAIC
jgi:hypothetical protein